MKHLNDKQTVTGRNAQQGRFLLALIIALGMASAGARHLHAAESAAPSQGFSYRNDRIPDGPWSLHVVRIDRTNSDYELHTICGTGRQLGMLPLPEMVRGWPTDWGRPVAAINGDFYRISHSCTGDPYGLQIINGELISAPDDRNCFWIDAQRAPHITNIAPRFRVIWPGGTATEMGLNEERPRNSAVLYSSAVGRSTLAFGGRELVLERNGNQPWLPLRANCELTARVREINPRGNTPLDNNILVLSLGPELLKSLPAVNPGDVVKLNTDTVPHLGGALTGIGGGTILLRNGKRAFATASNVRHPRVAVGYSPQHIYLVVVDGRQGRLSIGMTVTELADYMARMGCTDVLNLDGGGSATCWVLGQVANSPSEGRARPVANGLLVVKKTKPH